MYQGGGVQQSTPGPCWLVAHKSHNSRWDVQTDMGFCSQVAQPSAILNIIQSAETMRFKGSADGAMPQPGKCEVCGYISSQRVCKACVLLEGLKRGLPNLGISRTSSNSRAGSRAGLHKGLQNVNGDAHDGGERVEGHKRRQGSVTIAYEV